ncbi:MAG: HAD family hydrolase [Nitrospiraceae bacterium]
MDAARRLAVFDLDGTLTRRDSYLPYLIGFLVRHPRRLVRTLHLPWQVCRFVIGGISNTDLKRQFLHACLGGVRRAEVRRWTEAFVDGLIARGFRRDALAALEQHRQNGDVLVLLTASFDLYADELARRLKFDQVICTQAEWRGDRLSGNLASPNRYGAEKLRCLTELKKAYPAATIIAYADHHSDLPLLRFADKGILINGTAHAQTLAARDGIPCLQWRR